MTTALSWPELSLWLGACVVFVLFSGLYSGSETGLYCLNQARLRLAAHKKAPAALRLQELFADRAGLLFTTLVGTNLANFLAPVCLTYVFLAYIEAPMVEAREQRAELYTTLILTPLVFIFGEIVPKNLFQRNPDKLMNRASRLLRSTHFLFSLTGINWLQRRISRLAAGDAKRQMLSGSAFHSRLGVYQMLREGAAEGALTLTQSTILERIHELKSIRVQDVMVPRNQVVMLESDASHSEIERMVRRTRYSRLPVCTHKRRRVVGVIHLLDILTADPGKPISETTRPPITVSPDLPVLEALAILQREFRRMAIVVNPKDRCLGIVTVKDLVEEVVGELAAW